MSSLLLNNTSFASQVRKAVFVDISLRHPSAGQNNDHLYNLMLKMIEINDLQLTMRSQVIEKLQECEPNDDVVRFLLANLESSSGVFKFSKISLKNIACSWLQLKTDWEKCKKEFIPWKGEAHFIRGEKSSYIDVKRGDYSEIEHFFPNNLLHDVLNAGHWPHFDNPIDFFRIVSSILTEK